MDSHLVVELDSAGDGLGEGEARGLADNTAQLVPFLLGNVLGDQAVLGLDIREFCHGSEKQTTRFIQLIFTNGVSTN